jgi:uncharacterized protein (UPF0335 family)
MADIGDNSGADPLNMTAQGQLKSIVERIERLEVEKAEVAEQIKEVFAEAKGNGFDVKILRKVIRRRKQDRAKQQEEDALMDLYLSALGELPLFERASSSEHEGITSITLTMAGGKSVTGTPDQLAAAERMVRGVPEEDALYDQAVALVRRDGKASTSYVQRKLQVGYNRAAALVERMQAQGIVSHADITGKRQVLRETTT